MWFDPNSPEEDWLGAGGLWLGVVVGNVYNGAVSQSAVTHKLQRRETWSYSFPDVSVC